MKQLHVPEARGRLEYIRYRYGRLFFKKKTQIELLDMKTTMSEMKNTLNRINGGLDIAEEKMGSSPTKPSVKSA